MFKKLLPTFILCLSISAAKAQVALSVGCTTPPCFPCITSFTGTWTSSDNTIANVDASTGYITGIGAGTAIISFTYTVAGCGSGLFTSTVNVTPSFSVTGIDEVSPFTLTGDLAYTYSGGLTLTVTTVPSSLPGATYTWDDGSGPVTVSTATYSPPLTASGSTVIHNFTVTVMQGSTISCSATTTVDVVVPASGCSPYDYYNVNAYRTLDGLTPIPLATCPDCGTTQPFHTITAPTLDATNTADNNNYYVVNNATLGKPIYNQDNFFMDGGVSLSVSSSSSVALVQSHLFSALACHWNGINVDVTSLAAGSLNLVNNTLIENVSNLLSAVNVNCSGSYYNPGMQPIIANQQSIFNSNFGGISIQNYTPSTSIAPPGTQLPFNLETSIFTNRDFADGGPIGSSAASNYPFSWPNVSTLSASTPSPTDPGFGLDTYTPRAITSATGHHGIYMANVGNRTLVSSGGGITPDVYAYNYAYVGSTSPDPSFGLTNLYDNIDFGIQFVGANAQVYNNTLRHIALIGIELIGNTQNDVQIAGNPPDNTNNRFYAIHGYGVNCQGGTPYDFTCNNGLFTSSTLSNFGMYLFLDNPAQHNGYNIVNNTIYNYNEGITIQYSSGPVGAGVLNGTTNILNNSITGKLTAGGPEVTIFGIHFTDLRTYTGVADGNVNIDQNTIKGVRNGVFYASNSMSGSVNNNQIDLADYGLNGTGINNLFAPLMTQIQGNIVGGFGWNCSGPTIGILCNTIGSPGNSVNVTCNTVHDINYGFEFQGVSTLQWTDNQMMRNQVGMHLTTTANIGTQGSVCNPIDNHWDNGTCSICVPGTCSDWPLAGWSAPGIFQTYVDGPTGTAATSPLYVRTTPANYYPVNNGGGAGATPYAAGSSIIDASIGCGGPLPPTPACAQYPGFRPAHATTIFPAPQPSVKYTVFPNPTDGHLTITQSAPSTTPVSVTVYNTLGQKMYSALLQFEGGRASINLKNAVPGMYQVTLSNGDGEISNNKIVIEKQQ